jgi:hypothetical protein
MSEVEELRHDSFFDLSIIPLFGLQVEQVGHDFFVYLDKATNSVRVLYKRKTRGYGVIVPNID